ncbi:MAG: T9SS type A sorting domain-containing protein, partial [Candidatus Fermentibacteraceae bacterium]
VIAHEHNGNCGENQDRYGALLMAHQGQPYFDELAFTVAYLSWVILANPNWDESVLVENAQGIYVHDPLLSYVNVVDYPGDDYYSTTEYNTIVDGDTVWVEIPKEIYYHYVVMPKVSDERPLNDSSVYNEFWRQYLWDMDDAGYPVLSEVLNSNVQVFWDQQTKSYGWSSEVEFSDSLHAVDIVTGWVRATIDAPASGNRPIQPNVIAHEHNGNCGENQDLLAAAARLALIPTACVMDINEDHVWCQAWWEGTWHGWYVDTFSNDYCAYDKDRMAGGKDCSCIWYWRNDGFTYDYVAYYSNYCNLTVTVTDSAGVPVDNATVQIASEGWQTSELYRGTWGQTDGNGQITFELGDSQNYYLNIATALGNYGAGGYEMVIENSIPDQQYFFEWSPPALMPELPLTEQPGGSWTKYLVQVNFDLPADLMNGRDYYANPRSEYAEPQPGGTADFFIVDSDNWELYQAGEEFDCYELIQGQSTGEVWFYAPHTDDWYIVFSGDRHQGFLTFANAAVTLWKHDGTGIEGAESSGPQVSVLPNPCRGVSSVRFATVAPGEASVQVFDLQGRLVQTLHRGFLEEGSHGIPLDASDLASGLYFVRITASGVEATRSVAVIR